MKKQINLSTKLNFSMMNCKAVFQVKPISCCCNSEFVTLSNAFNISQLHMRSFKMIDR